MPNTPEALIYQQAYRIWQEFHAKLTKLNVGECLLERETHSAAEITEALRILPACERIPVAFGVFFHVARHWSPMEQTVFIGEFIAGPSEVERHLLEAAARGALKPTEKLPVTLEEFPSRIWQRAVASGSATRLVNAGHQAVLAMIRLCFQYEGPGEATNLGKLKSAEKMEFLVPSSDLPLVVDLLGIPPFTLPEMKGRVLERIMCTCEAGKFIMSVGQDAAFSAWVFADTSESEKHIAKVVRQARNTLQKLRDRKSFHSSHHAQRIGRILFRLGLRRESMRCAKAVGITPWQDGWQFQSIRSSVHTRIRNLLIQRGGNTGSWETEPALACSAMSLPLWLKDPVNRVTGLKQLFEETQSCPWIFPRLHHVYQWHVALAGKQAALAEIETIAPEWTVGLTKKCQLLPELLP